MSLASMLGRAAVVVEEVCQEVSEGSRSCIGSTVRDSSFAALLGANCDVVDSDSNDEECSEECSEEWPTSPPASTRKPRKRARSPATRNNKSVSAELLAMECSPTCTCAPAGSTCSFNLRSSIPMIVQLIVDARATLHQAGRAHSSEHLFNQLLSSRQAVLGVAGKYRLHFPFAAVPVCSKVWCELHGLRVTDSRVKRVFAALRKGDTTWEGKANRSTGGRGWRGAWCGSWCRDHVKKFAEFNPATMEASLDPEPLEVRHMLYVSDFKRRVRGSRPGSHLQFSRFAEIWKDFFEDGYTDSGQTFKLGLRKPRSGFSCNLCQMLMALRRKATTRREREEITFKLKQHLQQVIEF